MSNRAFDHSFSFCSKLKAALLLALTLANCGAAASAAGDLQSGSSDPRDWAHFNPYKFNPPEKLVPSSRLFTKGASIYSRTPSFPHDPVRSSVIYGRGQAYLPTEIYAKAFDILQIAGKYFQAPAAGQSKNLTLNGQSVSLYGTSWYTPLSSHSFAGNPVQVSPFDPTRIFYRANDLWPAVIYGEPGKEISIAGQTLKFPAAGESKVVVFGADGRLKDSAGSGASGGEPSERVASEKGAFEKAASEKAAAAKAAAEKVAAEKVAAEKAATEKGADENFLAENSSTDKTGADDTSAEKTELKDPLLDLPVIEKTRTDITSSSNQSDKTLDLPSTGSGVPSAASVPENKQEFSLAAATVSDKDKLLEGSSAAVEAKSIASVGGTGSVHQESSSVRETDFSKPLQGNVEDSAYSPRQAPLAPPPVAQADPERINPKHIKASADQIGQRLSGTMTVQHRPEYYGGRVLGNLDVYYVYQGYDPDPTIERAAPLPGSPFAEIVGHLEAGPWNENTFGNGYIKVIKYNLIVAKHIDRDQVNYPQEYGSIPQIFLEPSINGTYLRPVQSTTQQKSSGSQSMDFSGF